MPLELLLSKDGRVLCRGALSDPARLRKSFDQLQLEDIATLGGIGANAKRLRVLIELAKGRELRFSDVMQIATNPKIAQDCLQPLIREGLVSHGERGSVYKATPRGLALAAIMAVGLGKMLGAIELELEHEHA